MRKLGIVLLFAATCLCSPLLARAERAPLNAPAAPLSQAQVATALGLSLPNPSFPPAAARACVFERCALSCDSCAALCGTACAATTSCGHDARGCGPKVACFCNGGF